MLSEKERKRQYYLKHQEEMKKKAREYYATKVKPRRKIKSIPSHGPFSALFIGVEND